LSSGIVVTGSSGFLGSAIVKELLKRKHEVVGIDIVPASKWMFASKLFKFHRMSVVSHKIYDIVEGKTVIHCGAKVPITRSSFAEYVTTNATGSYNIALGMPKKYIFISSSAVYGVPNRVIKEHTKYKPIENYGKSKLMAEGLLSMHHIMTDMPLTIIRPRTIIGNGRMGMMDFLFPRIMKNKPVYLLGDGKNKFQFLALDDLVSAIMKCIDLDYGFHIYNLGTDDYTTLKEDIEDTIVRVGSKSKVICLPKCSSWILRVIDNLGLSPMTRWHYDTISSNFVFDISIAEKELGWHPLYSNKLMLFSAYNWYSKHKGEGNTPHTKSINKKLLEWI